MESSVDFGDPNAWDDTALVDSWNEALAEYKKYHSIHARGERVEDVIKKFEKDKVSLLQDQDANAGQNEPAHVDAGNATTMIDDSTKAISGDQLHNDHPMTENAPTANIDSSSTVAQSAQGIPQALLATVQDEALKNLMMSWYYAGYYTGLVEGQRQSQQAVAGETNVI